MAKKIGSLHSWLWLLPHLASLKSTTDQKSEDFSLLCLPLPNKAQLCSTSSSHSGKMWFQTLKHSIKADIRKMLITLMEIKLNFILQVKCNEPFFYLRTIHVYYKGRTDVHGSKPCKQQLTNRVIWQAVNSHLKGDFIIFSTFLGNCV